VPSTQMLIADSRMTLAYIMMQRSGKLNTVLKPELANMRNAHS